MMGKRLATILAALSFAICCGGEVGSTDGNTSWLKCPANGCGAGKECVEGRCVVAMATRTANADAGNALSLAHPDASPTNPPSLPTNPSPPATEPSPPPPASTSPTSPVVADAGVASCTQLSDPLGGKGTPVSFRNDVLPIFGLSCVTSDCHSPQDQKAGLNLGHKCGYDANAKWKCTFPSQPNADPTQPQPDDEQTVADVYASLLAPSSTVKSPTVYRVKPGDPENSFLVLSLANQQNSRGYACVDQDPSHETDPLPCGASMPQGSDPFCAGASQPKFATIVAWIAQGAPNN
ncbi:MAG TPA: hypothetical protein VHC69_34240 [Polyangiaceae bacterium]|nr:hypothetical protein [Polyangiaceae bacterium]